MKTSSLETKMLFSVHSIRFMMPSVGMMKMNDINYYDPDGGYWDQETDTWIKYEDMDNII